MGTEPSVENKKSKGEADNKINSEGSIVKKKKKLLKTGLKRRTRNTPNTRSLDIKDKNTTLGPIKKSVVGNTKTPASNATKGESNSSRDLKLKEEKSISGLIKTTVVDSENQSEKNISDLKDKITLKIEQQAVTIKEVKKVTNKKNVDISKEVKVTEPVKLVHEKSDRIESIKNSKKKKSFQAS